MCRLPGDELCNNVIRLSIVGQMARDHSSHHGIGLRTRRRRATRSEEHTSELQPLMRISYAVFCLQQKQHDLQQHESTTEHQPLIITTTTICRLQQLQM